MCIMDYVPFIYPRTQEQDYRVDFKSLLQAAIIAFLLAIIPILIIKHRLTISRGK